MSLFVSRAKLGLFEAFQKRKNISVCNTDTYNFDICVLILKSPDFIWEIKLHCNNTEFRRLKFAKLVILTSVQGLPMYAYIKYLPAPHQHAAACPAASLVDTSGP